MRMLFAAALLCGAAPQDAKVDQAAVDRAIDNGAKYLRTRLKDLGTNNPERPPLQRSHELVLWTLLHAGVPEKDADFQELMKFMLEQPLERTYGVSLQAMILEKLGAEKHWVRLQECAQYLVDNQCRNGQWGYGAPVDLPKFKPAESGTRTKITVKQRQFRGEIGDNSCSQYAALGMRACAEAGIEFEDKVLERAGRAWVVQMQSDGGWCYGREDCATPHKPYGSMTAGALGSIAIFRHLLGKKWKDDARAKKAVEWLTKNFTIAENPGSTSECQSGGKLHRHYYHLYALERAGMLCGLEKFGDHDWYREGAKRLLQVQAADGSWPEGKHPIEDTCFAILFLRRGTRPLATPGSKDK